MPNLTALRAFEAAARHESFTKAAKELGMTQAAVSQQVKALEIEIACQLFTRRPQVVTLTPAGRQLSEQMSYAFGIMGDAFDGLARADEAVLSVAALPSFAAAWLVPRLGQFQFEHPNVAVRLKGVRGDVDLIEKGFDVCIRPGRGEWPGLKGHELFAMNFAPMCSPSFLEKHGPFNTPAAMLSAPLVDRHSPWWRLWLDAAGETASVPEGSTLQLGAQNLEHIAASQGFGIALLTPALFKEELEKGQLIQLFETVAHDGRGYWFVYPETRSRTTKVKLFAEWILAQALS
ncbi:LysR substrate-binding domain-containing protein [Ensifer sp. YR511]|uniref:LysR substrate-binding domain-containing protein n=1 Tax=Ensifer sp. YR511 TaxID=1855294 RepID=UPI00115F7CD7|nr:LysR substrate-binding domain-containing protein [Ensifer sp. YR511]